MGTKKKSSDEMEKNKEQMQEQIMAAWVEGMNEAEKHNTGVIASELFKEKVKDLSLQIKILLVTTVDNYKEIAKNLLQVYNEIYVLSGDHKVSPREHKKIADANYTDYAWAEFNIKKSRALEYKTLACREDVLKLELPISHLIELSRLDEKSLSDLLKVQDESVIRHISFRQMQAVVKSYNANRKKKGKNKSAKLKLEANGIQESQGTSSEQELLQDTSEREGTVSEILQNRIPALDLFIKQFKAMESEFKASEVPASYANELEKIAKWCFAASDIEKKVA
jgi:hypothetical protein